MKYNVLVLGSGGREHALAWKISGSPLLGKLFCMPGNPGTASFATNLDGKVSDFSNIRETVLDNNISMVVVGPEDPLVNGLRDYFKSDSALKNILFIGPDKTGAMLEGSKEFAKKFMSKYGIPTAAYRSFTSARIKEAVAFLKTLNPPYVLKADGLAAGKGVLIIDSLAEAEKSLSEMFSGKFGDSGKTVVVEQFLSGIEVSVFILTDGKGYIMLPEAKDYKRISDGDKGLNTGGMGSVSPVPFFNEEFRTKVVERIVKPTVEGIGKEGYDYHGFVFIGLMNCGGEPYVIEYNVRMGDPETESVMMRIESDFLEHLIATAEGNLSSEKISVCMETAVTVVAVSGGYPESYRKGFVINGLSDIKGCTVFHAGTSFHNGEIVNSGGRVLAVTAKGKNISDARGKVYSEMEKISFEGMGYRKDIGMDLNR